MHNYYNTILFPIYELPSCLCAHTHTHTHRIDNDNIFNSSNDDEFAVPYTQESPATSVESY